MWQVLKPYGADAGFVSTISVGGRLKMHRTAQAILFVLLFLAIPATALATEHLGAPGEDDFDLEAEFVAESETKVFDPLSGYNRLMTQVNDRLYFWMLKPVAKGYRKVVPEGGRRGIGRFFRNLMMPVRLANNLLQLKFKQAGTELARFTINSTYGVLGFGDPAKKWFELEAYPEDFGQTLGRYGVGGGVHIVLPVLGPSNLRDTVGRIPDYFLTPINYIDPWEAQWAARGSDRINHTSLHIGEYESLKKDAIDLYTFLRDTYEQNRKKRVEE